MADPDTNLEMVELCIQRANALEITLRSIITNTDFANGAGKTLAEERLKLSSLYMTGLLSLLNKVNTKA